MTIAVVGSRTGVQRCRTSGASTVRWGCTVDGDGSTARRWQHSSTVMAAQHGDGCTAGGDGYASNRTAGSDDSEDC